MKAGILINFLILIEIISVFYHSEWHFLWDLRKQSFKMLEYFALYFYFTMKFFLGMTVEF